MPHSALGVNFVVLGTPCQNGVMSDRRPSSDLKRREAERMREIARRAPPLADPLPPFPIEPPLFSGLADLASWWLEVRCQCGAVGYPPLRLLAAERGWQTPLGSVLPRLRCRRCRCAPISVDLIDNPASGAVGVPGRPGRRLKLSGSERGA
jgi:hypothetical protein